MKICIIILVALSSLLFWTCSNGGGPPPVKAPEEYLAEGWQAYSAKNYSLAVTDFNSAAQGKPSLVDAFNGAGWANAKLNALSVSVAAFGTGLTKEPSNVQIMAGLSLVFNAQKQYDSSVARAGQALSISPAWVFTRDTSVNASDLHLLLAEDYFGLTPPRFGASLHEVQLLDPPFSADTLTIAGQTSLAVEIEHLGTLY